MEGRGSRLAALAVLVLAVPALRPTIKRGLEAIRCGIAANRAAEFIRPHLPSLAKGLRTRQGAIMLDEYNVLFTLSQDARLWVHVYYNPSRR